MLRTIRLTLAIVFFTFITLLFLDFTGTLHGWMGWMAKIQFIPALLALNAGVVLLLIVLTLLFGRVYCSVICPLGVFQDIISRFAGKRKKNRFRYSPALKWLRYGMLALFALALVAGIRFHAVVSLLEPYSSYGRIASNLFAPVYQWSNNLLAHLAERADSYAFYETEVWIKNLPVFIIAAITFIALIVLAWRNGRTYCNTVCPVGTILGFLSKYSLFKPVIDTTKCNGCGLCARNCKASCINSKAHKIDYSRCVSCMNCLDKCKQGAISYTRRKADTVAGTTEVSVQNKNRKTVGSAPQVDDTRRAFLSATALLAATTALKAQEKKVDGGLAAIENKKIPARATAIVPPGALSTRNFAQHCTACQLCVAVCPNQVLRPSSDLTKLMQPEVSYERGYCRPECTKCSEVCPAGAIRPITKADKSAIQIGHAVWIKENCICITDDVECGNCARHCPVNAIQMVASDPENAKSRKIPVVNAERCIGCGACENLCPSRPFSAIYVEGHIMHRTV
ncbi:4Fe-4S binding protein [uncultured Bacteroides sp.]|uniref:4Fe-4S binding protein n=1 Tax=uncultured Bacteroides sp. TaxID=162156 RepID=UPI0026011A55|nr:4Fe-4S binding protein [uncultured Bacteroides sp.]